MSAKINVTYDGRYYVPEDYDYKKMPHDDTRKPKRGRGDATAPESAEQARRRAKNEAKGGGADGAAGDKKRTTWMVAFSVICDSCQEMVPKSTKVYVNVTTAPVKYMGCRIYDLEMRCTKCGFDSIVFRTDPKTRGYTVLRGGRMAGGDWAGINEANAKAEEEAKAQAATVVGEADEAQRRMEQHQQAQLEAERVDEVVLEALERTFFPIQGLFDDVERRANAEADDADREAMGPVLGDDERAAAHDEFQRLRAELGVPASRKAPRNNVITATASNAASANLFAGDAGNGGGGESGGGGGAGAAASLAAAVLDAPDLDQLHDSMLRGLQQGNTGDTHSGGGGGVAAVAAAATAVAADGAKPPPAARRKRGGGLAAMMADL